MIRVLLVDDSDDVRALFRASLGLAPDVEVVGEAASAADAVSAAERLQPDVVVLDWQMPEMDGPDAVPLLRAVSATSRIILFSNRFGPAAEAQALAAGADLFLEKQSNLDALVLAMRDLLRPPRPSSP